MKGSEVIMMCGVSGSGKTTFAKQKEQEGYIRLSIDERVWKDYGQLGVDFTKEEYHQITDTIELQLKDELMGLLKEGQNVVIDFSFWSRAKRNEYRTLIESQNGQVTLVYMKASFDVLQGRLKERNKQIHANAPYEIGEVLLREFYSGFEEPVDEGEIILVQNLS